MFTLYMRGVLSKQRPTGTSQRQEHSLCTKMERKTKPWIEKLQQTRRSIKTTTHIYTVGEKNSTMLFL